MTVTRPRQGDNILPGLISREINTSHRLSVRYDGIRIGSIPKDDQGQERKMSRVTHRETITLFDRDRTPVDQVAFDHWQEENYNAGEALIEKHLPQLCKNAHLECSPVDADSVDREPSSTETTDPLVSRELVALVVQAKTIGFIEYLREGDAQALC